MNLDIPQILKKTGIEQLNPMQHAVIEAAGQHNQLVLLSPTGSGKTLAFTIAMLKAIKLKKFTTNALIIAPSRELALQIEKVVKSATTDVKISCCYGGHEMYVEENNLKEPPAILIGTPGRIADHMRRGNITTETINILIMDEYDKQLELGFEEEIRFLLGELPQLQKKIFTSATPGLELPDYAGITEPTILDYTTGQPEMAPLLTVELLHVADKDKAAAMFNLMCYLGNTRSIIFLNHRESTERVADYLIEGGIPCVVYHGGMEQLARETALVKFRNGSVNVLVTTDLGSRGLDISGVDQIVHYHLPLDEASFIHRNGRTARMKESGAAIVMIGPEEEKPEYIPLDAKTIEIPRTEKLPTAPQWVTWFIAAGKKNKVNKVDIVGFLGQKGGLKKEEIGLIEVRDFISFVAIKKGRSAAILQLVKDEKIKNKSVKIAIAR